MTTRRSDTAELTVRGPVNGLGELDRSGAYIEVRIATHASEQFHRISLGSADVLAAEIWGILAKAYKKKKAMTYTFPSLSALADMMEANAADALFLARKVTDKQKSAALMVEFYGWNRAAALVRQSEIKPLGEPS